MFSKQGAQVCCEYYKHEGGKKQLKQKKYQFVNSLRELVGHYFLSLIALLV